MLKKLTSLLLSLLLCLSLLPGQADADTVEDAVSVQTEASETVHPDDSDELVMPTAGEYPEEIGTDPLED